MIQHGDQKGTCQCGNNGGECLESCEGCSGGCNAPIENQDDESSN